MAVSLPLVELVASTPWTGDQIRVTKQYHTTRVYLSRIYLILPLRDYSMAAIYVPKNHIANKNLMATHGSFFRGAQTNPIIGDGMTLAAFGGSLINARKNILQKRVLLFSKMKVSPLKQQWW